MRDDSAESAYSELVVEPFERKVADEQRKKPEQHQGETINELCELVEKAEKNA